MLQGKIDEDGNLKIFRGNMYINQGCPFSVDTHCGDWCPQFGEPDKIDPIDRLPSTNKIFLDICEQKVWAFDELIDERPKE